VWGCLFLETPKFRGSLGDFTPLALHETCTEAETESGRVEKEGKTRSLQLRTRYLRDTGTIEVFVRLRFVFLLSHEPTSPCNWRRGGSATLPWAKVSQAILIDFKLRRGCQAFPNFPAFLHSKLPSYERRRKQRRLVDFVIVFTCNDIFDL